jgi:hypothetical protein
MPRNSPFQCEGVLGKHARLYSQGRTRCSSYASVRIGTPARHYCAHHGKDAQIAIMEKALEEIWALHKELTDDEVDDMHVGSTMSGTAWAALEDSYPHLLTEAALAPTSPGQRGKGEQ